MPPTRGGDNSGRNTMKKQLNKSQLLTIIRGILAGKSADEDDPFRRVILRPLKGVRAALELAGAASGGVEKYRKYLAAKLKAKSAPVSVGIKGLGVFEVTRDSGAAPLLNKTALVTGAAGAIGAGICKGLLEQGCHLAASDLAGARLDKLVKGLGDDFGDRVIAVPIDVTAKASVAAGFDAVSRAWGGVDIVVVNAGIAHVCSLEELSLEDFRKLEKVNIEGTLLTLAESGRRLRLQGTGGDIVLISTKNVFAPGARFGAYSASKAAAHQLARIASQELADCGVRVNMVSPDAVFGAGDYKSGLWRSVGPDRMKGRGIKDMKGLQEYYRGRNLLKAKVTARHVANAVLFFVTRQTPTTGATIPVDGGLPDSTPR